MMDADVRFTPSNAYCSSVTLTQPG